MRAAAATTTKYRTSPHRGAAAPAQSAGLSALEVAIKSQSFYEPSGYGDFAKLAGTCRALRSAVRLLRKSEAAQVIRVLSETPDFDAG